MKSQRSISDQRQLKSTDKINDSLSVNELIRKGEILYAQGDLHRAKQLFKDVLEIQKNHVETLNNLGVIAFDTGDMVSAEQYFRNALVENPTHFEALINLARVGESIHSFDLSAACLKRALIIDKQNPHLWNMLGNTYLNLSDVDKAKEAFQYSFNIDNGQENISLTIKLIESMQNLHLDSSRTSLRERDSKYYDGKYSIGGFGKEYFKPYHACRYFPIWKSIMSISDSISIRKNFFLVDFLVVVNHLTIRSITSVSL